MPTLLPTLARPLLTPLLIGFWALCAMSTARAAAPPAGVYGCYDVRMAADAPGCVRNAMGCYGLQITPAPVVMFGLIDGARYADFDGAGGRYQFDDGAGILTMVDGPRQGWRYRKTAEWSFALIDNNTGGTLYTCPLDPGKDPHKGPW